VPIGDATYRATPPTNLSVDPPANSRDHPWHLTRHANALGGGCRRSAEAILAAVRVICDAARRAGAIFILDCERQRIFEI